MPRTQVINNSFTSGELDPILHERYDNPLHSAGCSRLHNFLIVPQGGVKRRPGYRHVAFAKNATATRLLPFIFSATEGAVIEAGAAYFRFYVDNGQLVSPAPNPLEVVTPYTTAQLQDIHTAQAGDILTIAHRELQQRELVRRGATDWRLRLFRATPPPTFEYGYDPAVALTLSATTGQAVTATAASAIFLASDVDRSLSQDIDIGLGFATITEVVSPTVATIAVVDAFSTTALEATRWKLDGSPAATLHINKGMPVGALALLILQGVQDDAPELVTNGSFTDGLTAWGDASSGSGNVFVSLDHAGISGGESGVGGIRQQMTTQAGTTYRLVFDVAAQSLSLKVGSTIGGQELVGEFSYPVQIKDEVIFTATSATTWIEFRNSQNYTAELDNVSVKIYDIPGWRTDDVGRYVRMNEGIIQITQFVSVTRVRGVIRKSLTDTLDALAGAWSLEVPRWSNFRGWPHVVAFWGQRLVFSRTNLFPAMNWASRIGVYRDFGTGLVDDDAVEFEVAATEVNPVEWLVGERSLIIGTTREEFSIRGEIGRTFTPTDIDVDSPSRIGGSSIQPLRTQRAVLFVQRGGRRLREITAEEATEQNRRNSDLTIRAEHLTRGGIKRMAFQQDPDTILWVVTTDGRLLSLTYLQEHVVFGWAQHPMPMTVLDVAVIPHPAGDRDQVWLLTRLPGQTLPSVGYLEDGAGFYGALMTDAGVVGSFDPPTQTVTGLEHLEGQTVTVLTDGSRHPDVLVTDGAVTLNYPATDIEVGLSFIPRLTTLRPTYQNVPLSGLVISNVQVTISVIDTLNAVINGERVVFTTTLQPLDTAQALYTGLKDIDSTGWDLDATVDIVQDMPYPITLRGIFRTIEVEEP